MKAYFRVVLLLHILLTLVLDANDTYRIELVGQEPVWTICRKKKVMLMPGIRP